MEMLDVLRVVAALGDPGTRTRDVGGRVGTADPAAAVCALTESAPLP
jgi:hypothetical protein